MTDTQRRCQHDYDARNRCCSKCGLTMRDALMQSRSRVEAAITDDLLKAKVAEVEEEIAVRDRLVEAAIEKHMPPEEDASQFPDDDPRSLRYWIKPCETVPESGYVCETIRGMSPRPGFIGVSAPGHEANLRPDKGRCGTDGHFSAPCGTRCYCGALKIDGHIITLVRAEEPSESFDAIAR